MRKASAFPRVSHFPWHAMAHADEYAAEWPAPCVSFVKQLRAALPASVDVPSVGALDLAEYQARAKELCAMLAESGGEKARTRKVRRELDRLLQVVWVLYDYLKTTAVASRNVYKEFGGLLDEIDLALAHVAHLSAGVDEQRAGWHSRDTYASMLADFR